MKKEIKVSFPTDENGLTGRECPVCNEYFKVKFGTGIKGEVPCKCPYCRHTAEHQKFMTREQDDYLQSVIMKEALGPVLSQLDKSFKKLEHSTRNSFIQIKVKTSGNPVRIKHYQEKELETDVTCDSCGLEFAVYGVFATCPDCGRLNASVIFVKSVEVAEKRLLLVDSVGGDDLKEAVLKDSLSGGISSFDAFGKVLRIHRPDIFPDKPRNLFQNLKALELCLQGKFGRSLDDLLGIEEAKIMKTFFQVRHIYEHNMGVVDDDFISNVPSYAHMKGRKYPLNRGEIAKFLSVLRNVGLKIERIISE